MKKLLFSLMMLVTLFTTQVAVAQAPKATPAEAITGLLTRIGGNSAPGKFEIVIDANLAENGKDVFIITEKNGKPCIKGNSQLSVATGINWYLNHYAHINLTWNNLTTDLSQVTLPVPSSEEKHVCNTTYRYDFNTCTFSYSMAFWTWERWQQEIDWMALHGINAPLNLVGLEVVTRNFLRELGVSEDDIKAYIAGPGFMAWFAMNNLEGWGGTINSPTTGVDMSGNPDWWYARQEQLCRDMMQRMRELGMQPVIPGFSGQVPKAISDSKYNIEGFSSGDVVNVGSWASNFPHPGVVNPSTTSYSNLATIYYKHLHDVMGVSEFYSIDPFHEMSAPVTANVLYPGIMSHLDRCYALQSDEVRAKYNAPAQPKWIVQYWQGTPVTDAFSAMSSYGDRFIGLDLFADAPGKAKWNSSYYQGRPYIFCMLHNFGGRSGLHGRLESTMNDYFRALAKGNNCQGIGATPEGSETNPILYDMLFELPWMDVNNRPTVDQWLENYAYSRYGIQNSTALAALQNLKKSVWACPTDQQGTSEAVILARPNWTVNSVSSWSTAAIYWDTQDVRLAADQLISIADLIAENNSGDGTANYNYDAIDAIRQAMVDFAAELLPLIKTARNSGDTAEYTRLYKLYLQLMLDLDTMLSYDAGFKLERWTSLARNIADEGVKLGYPVTDNDRNWLEWNARTQVTVWANQNCDLHDYSNRCWAGLIKDFHYWRWKYFFENNGNAPSGGWYSGFEYPWTVDFNDTYNYAGDYSKITIPDDMTATEKAVETFGKYFGRVKGAAKNYIFPMGVATNATKSDVIPEVYRGQTVEFPLEIGKDVTISSVQIDLNGDGAMGAGETLTADGMNVTIPADAAIGKTKAIATFSDGTVITFNLAIVVNITAERTVAAATADANMGTVAIEGTSELSITNTEAVKITATAKTGYNFKDWTDAQGNVVSNDNPYIYYGTEDATFTANFIQDKWGVVGDNAFTAEKGTISDYKSFVHNLTFAYYNRDAETIYETTTAPESVFTTIPQIINVPRGASFNVYYDDGSGDGLKYCYFRAYIDLNSDGDFDDDGELLKEVGTNGSNNTAVCSNTVNVLLPYDAPLGITHMRLRFDGAFSNSNKPSALGAKDGSNRPVYEIILNVTEGSDKAAHITVESNCEDWGAVEVSTDETPAGIVATEWDVTKGVPFNVVATPAGADVEFLGWYDHYGRLLTTELEYSMYAIEDATYTARFRKALEIDGWEFEYRTVPGKDIVTNKLANGVKPENGKTYYIYAPTSYNSVSATRYLYDNNGTLNTTETANGSNYVWTCIVNDDNTYSFQNASGKYLANNGSYHISIGTTAAKYYLEDPTTTGCALKNAADYTGGKYMVTKHDGSAFNRNGGKTNGEWCSDYVFTEVSVPEVVILTNIRKSGDHDLEIPSEVEILGEQCSIVGFDNNLFNNNKDLWSISLPATIESMSNNTLYDYNVSGVVESTTGKYAANDNNFIVEALGDDKIYSSNGWTIKVEGKTNGNTFNQWGSAVIATGQTPMHEGTSEFPGGFQIYLGKNGNVTVKINDGTERAVNGVTVNGDFTATIEYDKTNVTITINDGTNTGSVTVAATMSDIEYFSHAIPKGIDLDVIVSSKATPDPFAGCTNLMDITIAQGCENYYVRERALYATDGDVKLHELPAQENADAIRALGELIDAAKALVGEVAASVNPTGKNTKIDLQVTTENAVGYIWTNADHNVYNQAPDGGGIAHLVDGIKGDANNYFHTAYSNGPATEYHYIEVDLGENNTDQNFCFVSTTRHGDWDFANVPDKITVMLSDEKDANFVDIETFSNLPQGKNTAYTSTDYNTGRAYRYMRFKVEAENKFWHMAEFELYKKTSTAEVKGVYANLARVTASEVEDVYDRLADALYLYNNGGTADQLTAAYNVLKPLYDDLNAKKDNVFNGVYNINFNDVPVFVGYLEGRGDLPGGNDGAYRLFDGAVTHDGAQDGNTDEGYKGLHQSIIDSKVAADALFTIVPNGAATGYTLSAQGMYLKDTYAGWWGASAFSPDKEQAGVYMFEETTVNDLTEYRLKSTTSTWLEYVNDWGYVFGNNDSNDTYSTFSLTPVTEYTLTVPEGGVTTLCLPFNVVLPAGVTAYDLAKANITKNKNYSTYELVQVAAENETLAANTPVIVKATAGNHNLAITMDGEDAKASVRNSVLRSGIVKTTVAAGNNYTFDGVDFNIVTANTEIPANQCWMVLDENLGAKVYGSAPAYVLTTDEDNPVLYKIQVNRTYYTPTLIKYDENTKLAKLNNDGADYSYNAWYFMKGETGILIKPYNGYGKVLAADNSNDGASKVLAVEKGSKTIEEWTIEKYNDTEWYNIKGGSSYLSNNGGNNSNSLGFYNSASDGGSQFKFIPVTFTNDNARYYQLKDVAEYLGDCSALHTGTSVGLYDITGYTAAYDAASAIVTAGNKTAAADCHSAYTTLRSEYNNVSVNVASPDKIYYIKSVAAADGEWNYSTGKYVHTLSAATTRSDKTYNHSHLVFDAFNDITPKSLAAFQFEAVEGGYKIKNLHTGLYVKSFAADAEHMGAAEDAAVVKVSAYADGQVTLQIGDNSPMHAEKDGNVIVQWRAVPGNASLWTIDEVAEISDLDYTITMPADGYTTLYLPYNVVLPAGVTAYTVAPESIRENMDGSYSYELTEVATAGAKLAKGTAVVIKADEGDYEFAVSLDDTDAVGAAQSALVGTYFAASVESEDDAKRYSATVENGNLVFVAITESTPVAANTCWLETTVDADKIGAPGEVQATEILDGAVYRIKGRLSDGTLRTLYTQGGNKRILYTLDETKTDATTLFIAQKVGDKFKFVSALGNGIWSQEATLSEEGVELTVSEGSVNGAFMIVGNNGRRFCADGDNLDYYSNVGDRPAGEFVNENVTTDFVFEEVDAAVGYSLSMKSNSKWATLYLPYAVTVPEGLVAYYPHTPNLAGRVVTLLDLNGIVPAYTPVVIGRSEAVAASATATTNYEFTYTTEECSVDVSGYGQVLFGKLIDSYVAEEGKNCYVILTIGEKEAFYWIYKEYNAAGAYVGNNGDHIKCSANKAYMALEPTQSASYFSMAFEGTTGIDGVVVDGNAPEFIYDIQGRKITEITSPGIYIINGKATVVK